MAFKSNWEFFNMQLGNYVTFCHWEWGHIQLQFEGSDGPASTFKPSNDLLLFTNTVQTEIITHVLHTVHAHLAYVMFTKKQKVLTVFQFNTEFILHHGHFLESI